MQLERTASRVSLLEVKRRIVRVQPTCRWTFIDLIRLRDACMLEYFLETIYHLGRSWRAPGLLYAIASTQKQPTSLRSHKKHRWERSFSTEDHRRRTRLVAFPIFFFFFSFTGKQFQDSLIVDQFHVNKILFVFGFGEK